MLSIFVAAPLLVAAVSALPSLASNAQLGARGWVECPKGTWYSKCGNIDGCYPYDPCVNAFDSTPPPPTNKRRSAGCKPPSPPATCKPGETVRIIAMDFFEFPVPNPDAEVTAISGSGLVSVSRGGVASDQDTLAVFSGIPKEAKVCTFGWRHANKTEGLTFKVFGSPENGGFTAVSQISQLPKPLTLKAVKALVPANAEEKTIDFTNWDGGDFPARDHPFGTVTCGAQVNMYLTPGKSVTNGTVLLQSKRDSQNPGKEQGLYLDYQC